MVGSLNGKVILIKEKFVVVETAGVGYRVNLPQEKIVSLDINKSVFLWIYTHVREDQLTLYGFAEYDELEFFELLLGVSSIGPRSALAILSTAPMQTLARAISANDLVYLTKISGIGKKTAEKIILELREKIGKVDDINTKDDLDVLEALKTLGYGAQESRGVIQQLDKNLDTNQKIKEALKILNK